MSTFIIRRKLLITIIYITSISSINAKEWPQLMKYDTDLDFDITNDIETTKTKTDKDCYHGELCINVGNVLPNNKKRKSNLLNSAEEFLQPNYLANIPRQYFQTALTVECTCGIEHKMLDLGNDYIPRYISTAVCTGGGCWGTSLTCKPKQYKVRVLKRRREEEEESKDFIHLPSIVREGWILETISVIVACECKQ